MTRRAWYFFVLGIVPVAWLLRLDRIAAHAVWNDEAYSIYLAKLRLADMAVRTATDIHPPLYYSLLHFWIGFAGTSEFAVRALSATLGVLVVPLLFVLGRAIGGTMLGLSVSAVAAFSPFLVYYSQDTRMYSLLALLVSAAALFTWRSIRGDRWRYWLPGYVLATSLALYTHYYGILTFVAFNAAYAVLVLPALWAGRREQGADRRRNLAGWVAGQLLPLALFAPWLPVLWEKNVEYLSPGRGTALEKMLADLGRAFAVGESVPAGTLDWFVVAAWLLAAFGLAYHLRAGSRAARGGDDRKGAIFALLWLTVGFAVITLTSLDKRDFAPRYLLGTSPAFFLLLGMGLVGLYRLRRPLVMLGVGLLATGVVLSLVVFRQDPNHWRADHRSAIQTLTELSRPGDAVVLNAYYTFPVFEYYYRGGLPYVGLPAATQPDREATEKALADLANRHDRLWVMYWQDYFSDDGRLVETWLDYNAVRFYEQSFLGWVRLKGYETPKPGERDVGGFARLTGYRFSPGTLKAGENSALILNWVGLAAGRRDYQVFVHIVDSDYRFAAQHDGPPDQGAAPTSIWTPGIMVSDTHPLTVAADVPPGDYELRVGMYSLDDMKRLPTAEGDSLLVGKVHVEGP